MNKIQKGFTIIELIVVIIIVGILASVGMTQYTKVVEKGRAAEARLILGSLRTAEVAENMENGAYQTVANLGVAAPTACATTHYFKGPTAPFFYGPHNKAFPLFLVSYAGVVWS